MIDQLLSAHGFKVPGVLGALVGYLRRQRSFLKHWKPHLPGYGPEILPQEVARSESLRRGVVVYSSINTVVAAYFAMLGYEWALTTKSQFLLGYWTGTMGALLAPRGAAVREKVVEIMEEGERLYHFEIERVENTDGYSLSHMEMGKAGAFGRLGEWRRSAELQDGLLERFVAERSDALFVHVLSWNHMRSLFALGSIPEMVQCGHQYRAFNRHGTAIPFVTSAFMALGALPDGISTAASARTAEEALVAMADRA